MHVISEVLCIKYTALLHMRTSVRLSDRCTYGKKQGSLARIQYLPTLYEDMDLDTNIMGLQIGFQKSISSLHILSQKIKHFAFAFVQLHVSIPTSLSNKTYYSPTVTPTPHKPMSAIILLVP